VIHCATFQSSSCPPLNRVPSFLENVPRRSLELNPNTVIQPLTSNEQIRACLKTDYQRQPHCASRNNAYLHTSHGVWWRIRAVFRMLRRHLTSQGIVDNISSRNMALKRCIPLEMTAFRPPPALGHFRFSELACFPRGPRRILSALCRARATIHPHHRRHALGFIPLTEADYPHCARHNEPPCVLWLVPCLSLVTATKRSEL